MNSKPLIQMDVAELVVAAEPTIVSTVLGSCVSVALYSPAAGMGGICCFTLPSEKFSRLASAEWNTRESLDPMNYGTRSIPLLIEELRRRAGESGGSLQAKIVGGASLVDAGELSSKVGALNVEIAEEVLRKAGIRVVGKDVGGNQGRKLRYDTGTGRLRVAPIPDCVTDCANPVCNRATKGRAESTPAVPPPRKKVLIVDDSKTIRSLLTKVLSQDPALEVVATASDAFEAEKLIASARPDVMTLDVHMPGMDGVQFLQKLLPRHPIPVVMITSLNIDESGSVLRALELGAVDYIQKPRMADLASLSPLICERVREAASARVKRFRAVAKPISLGPSRIDPSIVVAIGSSTGGTEALKEVLTRLPAEIPPIVIVQHIPAAFSRTFADRLHELCPFEVKEAVDSDRLLPNRVLIAPGGLQMAVAPGPAGYQIRITDDPPVNRHKPSVDFLFNSVARHIGKRAIGVILTGMGADGADGLLKMRSAGARTIGQDEASSVVYGMPKAAAALGAVERVAALEDIPELLLQWLAHPITLSSRPSKAV